MGIYDNDMLTFYFNRIDDVYKKAKSLNNPKYKEHFCECLDNMRIIYEEYSVFLKDALQDGFRFSDYFSFDFSAEQAVEYFKENYKKSNIDYRILEFMIFGLIKYLGEIFELYDEVDLNDLCTLVDNNDYYYKLTYFSSNLLKLLENSRYKDSSLQSELPFLKNNKYQIFFTGLSLEDIEKLESQVRLQLINKLNSLATEVVIPNAEAIEHVKTTYNFPIHRIKLAYDYRIAFLRTDNVTAILGVTLKTGKDSDYSRYDSVAKKDTIIYKEIEDFINGRASENSDHYKVINILEETFRKKIAKTNNII